MSLFKSLTGSNWVNNDIQFLKELGIDAPDCELGEETFIGEVLPFATRRIPSLLPRIRIYATLLPAAFYRFEITRQYSDSVDDHIVRGIETIEITTGSGSFANYWPSVLLVADGMLDVGQTKRVPT